MSSNHLLASELFSVPNLKCVVTGGGTGTGLMIAQALKANGATVYIAEWRQQVRETTAARRGGNSVPIATNLMSTDSINHFAARMAEREPQGIHLLVNCAGVAEDQTARPVTDFTNADSIRAHLSRATPESWAETFQTNVTAQYFTSVAFVPQLAAGTRNTPGYSASIVNIAPISGVRAGSNHHFAYEASKAAFMQLSQTLAAALKGIDLRVNCIAPGDFPSERTAGGSNENRSLLQGDGRGEGLPAGRAGSDEDMAAAVLYLAGKGGQFLYNQVPTSTVAMDRLLMASTIGALSPWW